MFSLQLRCLSRPSGWLTTYIIRERGGGPSSGYITTGFYAGLALGRVILLPLNELVSSIQGHISMKLTLRSSANNLPSLFTALLPLGMWVISEDRTSIDCSLSRLDIVVWQVRSLIGDAVAASFMGLVLGVRPPSSSLVFFLTSHVQPLYPIIMNQATNFLPRHLLTGSIGWIAGFGQVGSAAFPFMTVS